MFYKMHPKIYEISCVLYQKIDAKRGPKKTSKKNEKLVIVAGYMLPAYAQNGFTDFFFELLRL